jgi:hypothetical protein
MCPPLPVPTMPADALSWLTFSQAISSFMSFAGSAVFATIQSGVSASLATGSRSRRRSYCTG